MSSHVSNGPLQLQALIQGHIAEKASEISSVKPCPGNFIRQWKAFQVLKMSLKIETLEERIDS